MSSDGNWAEISGDGRYRYALGRDVGDGPCLGWVMLNPSTADAVLNDQTIRQVMYFTRQAGYGSAWVANLFALRSPSPDILRKCAGEPAYAIGPDNDLWLRAMLRNVPEVVLAWGAHASMPWARDRRDGVLAMVTEYPVTVSCLGLTGTGEPRHPCRLAGSTPLAAFALPGPHRGVITTER